MFKYEELQMYAQVNERPGYFVFLEIDGRTIYSFKDIACMLSIDVKLFIDSLSEKFSFVTNAWEYSYAVFLSDEKNAGDIVDFLNNKYALFLNL